MIEFLSQAWPWYVAGPLIAAVMFTLLFFGESFGISANLRIMCSMCGAGKRNDFFQFEWKKQMWNIVLIIGAIIGGFVSSKYLSSGSKIELSQATTYALEESGLQDIGQKYVPDEIFGLEAISSWQGLLFLIVGGLLVGFGSRYAGGCTSGHAISGLSNLQLPSLIAVIGFFIGGLISTFFIIPLFL